MDRTTLGCRNCKNQFTIEPEDFAFYEKIKVPPPTWCPECRLVRRMIFMNERTLYRRKCDLCHRDFISLMPADAPWPVYCGACFWDKWDDAKYGQEIDWSKPFLQQYKEMVEGMPHTGQQQVIPTMVNSDYTCITSYLKNCYLLFNSDYDEHCGYSAYLEHSNNCFDLMMADVCEQCYGSKNLYKCSRTFFSSNCRECVDVAFSNDLKGCTHCFGCVNLRNKSYYFWNEPCSKEEYFERLAKIDMGSYKATLEYGAKLKELILRSPRKYMEGIQNARVSGDYISHSKNTFASHEVEHAEDAKFCQFLLLAPTRDSYDFTMWGGNATRMYECIGAGGGSDNVRFVFECWGEFRNTEYCIEPAVGGSDLFGCYASQQKHYCILNKQYSKEEYEALLPKIVEHMNAMPYVDAEGREYRYGEFFPPEMSFFAYNESLAQQYFPLTKKEALARGYRWRDPEEKHHTATKKSADLPDKIKEVDDSLLKEVIACGHGGTCADQCSEAFRIIPEELQFLKAMNLALPRLCPNCRHYERLNRRGLLALYPRTCMCPGKSGKYPNRAAHFHGDAACPNKFQTSHAPDQPEIVYCEQCYQAEVA